ncbi:MAG: iron-sulfur cluster biosynthesis family protein [Rhodocyclaceae bacterium]|nr:iron-sulfur cluster biosynthesis family protein [Rhodocyclaceae bacterium]
MFALTPNAAEQILRAVSTPQEDPDEPSCLRIAAKIEDGEIVYGMGFDAAREQDAVIESHGVTLLIAPPSQALLHGATLDFIELHPGEFQFVFINPNDPPQATDGCASQSGGCGSCGGGTAGGCN